MTERNAAATARRSVTAACSRNTGPSRSAEDQASRRMWMRASLPAGRPATRTPARIAHLQRGPRARGIRDHAPARGRPARGWSCRSRPHHRPTTPMACSTRNPGTRVAPAPRWGGWPCPASSILKNLGYRPQAVSFSRSS
jgi:hypothetical protein